MKDIIKIDSDKITFKIHVNPNSKKDEFAGTYGSALKLKVASPAVDGKANKGVINFFAKFFKIPKSKVKILKGEKSKDKIICIETVTDEIIRKIEEVKNANL